MPGGMLTPAKQSLGGYGTSISQTMNNIMMESDELIVPPAEMAQSNSEGDHDLARIRAAAAGGGDNDEYESRFNGSGNQDRGSGGSGEEDQDVAASDQAAGRGKRKRYHRHTPEQIQQMEAFYKECPHPDDKQRKELGRRLGLVPLQVKFWFQNKRTQMKTHNERVENTNLRAENERLRAENIRYREALSSNTCPNCGGPTSIGEISYDEEHYRMENAHLREEIDRLSSITAKYVGNKVTTNNYPMISHPNMLTPAPHDYLGFLSQALGPQQPAGGSGADQMYAAAAAAAGDILRSINGPPVEHIKPMIIELAMAALEELTRLAQAGEPLWVPAGIDVEGSVLNEEEYIRAFPHGLGPKPAGFHSEASRETATVIMNHMNLVEILMDVNQWSTMFSSIVSRAMTSDVLSTGVAGNYDGALQLMSAEFQIPSPLVATRESNFLRYSKQLSEGIWALVDVSLDDIRPSPAIRCRRRPSGCLIQEKPNGYSKVTWIEHVEVDNSGVHNLYKLLLNAGLGFGAKRWLGTLERQCERLASAMATNVPANNFNNIVITSSEGRKSMFRLAERMVISFSGGLSGSTAHKWTLLSGGNVETDDENVVRIMTRKSIDDPGRPAGIVLSAATSLWLPVSPKTVFDFLGDENSRNQWDILSNGGVTQEVAHFANGRQTGNCVSLLRVNSANSSQSTMLILQESCNDPSGSFIVYAPVDIMQMNMVINGGEPDYVALLPSGFAILPDGHPVSQGGGTGRASSAGSLLTVAFQILVDSAPNAKISLGSIATVNNLITCTVERIKDALLGNVAEATTL